MDVSVLMIHSGPIASTPLVTKACLVWHQTWLVLKVQDYGDLVEHRALGMVSRHLMLAGQAAMVRL